MIPNSTSKLVTAQLARLAVVLSLLLAAHLTPCSRAQSPARHIRHVSQAASARAAAALPSALSPTNSSSACDLDFPPISQGLPNISSFVALAKLHNTASALENVWFARGAAGDASHPPRPQLLYCYIPKNACSSFKLLLLRLVMPDEEWDAWQSSNRTRDARIYGAVHQRSFTARTSLGRRLAIGNISPARVAALLQPGAVASLVVTRNPYVRLLSGYLDKIGNGNFSRVQDRWLLFTYGFNRRPSFKEWVARLHGIWQHHRNNPIKRMNPHFAPQSSFCGMQRGLRFQYQVKLEDLHSTCPCLVRRLHLGHWVDPPPATNLSLSAGNQSDALPVLELPCSRWRDAQRDIARDTEGVGGAAAVGVGAAREALSATLVAAGAIMPHQTGAVNRLMDHYDRETAAFATEVFAEDLLRFGYRPWLGPPHPIQLS